MVATSAASFLAPASEAISTQRTSLDASVQTESSTSTSPLLSTPESNYHPHPHPIQDHEHDQLELLKYSNVQLNNIPQDYLESYPYPAFVLISGVPPSSDEPDPTFPLDLPWTRTKFANIKPFEPVWANRQWKKLARGHSLLDCLTMDNMRRLGDWLTGAQDANVRQRLAQAQGWKKAEWAAGAPGPGHLNHAGDLADQTDGDDGMYDPLGSLDSPQRPGGEANASIILEFAFASGPVQLQLSKTSLPIYQNQGSTRTLMTTHTFAVVTTTPVPDSSHEWLAGDHLPEFIPSRSSSQPRESSPVQLNGPLGTGGRARPPHDSRLSNSSEKNGRMHDPRASKDVKSCADGSDVPKMAGEVKPRRPLHFRGAVVHVPHPQTLTTGGKHPHIVELLNKTNWAATPLGPREQWGSLLSGMVSYVMHYPLPASIWWGNELTLIYNQEYANDVSNHPQLFARSGSASWAELWSTLGPLSEVVLNGTPILREDDFVLSKSYYAPRTYESYRSHVWVPLQNEEGKFTGIFQGHQDTTTKVLAERRATLLKDLGERSCAISADIALLSNPAQGRSLEEFDKALLDTLAAHPKDVPFALLFHVETTGAHGEPHKHGKREGSHSRCAASTATSLRLRYAGGVGVPPDHPSAPSTCTVELPAGDLRTNDMMATTFTSPEMIPSPKKTMTDATMKTMSNSIFYAATDTDSQLNTDCDHPQPADQWPFAEALHARHPIIVRDCSKLISGYPTRVWDELPTSAIVIPVMPNAEGSSPCAVLVLGLSCRLTYDAEYQAFHRVLRLQVTSLLLAALSYEEDVKRMHELADLDRAKSLLFSNVSHELFTPLSLIAGPLDDVLAELPAGCQKQSLDMARRNVERLSRLVAMLMDISSLEAGNMSSSFRRVNLGEVTRNVAAMFRHASDDAHLTYLVDCDLDNKEVYIDRDKYEKILFTLIGNALRFTSTGTIRVRVHYEGSNAVVTVQDTGVGIPQSELVVGEKRLDDDAFSPGQGGAGISLTFTKKLVQLHRGTFKIESHTAEESSDGTHGTKFIVTLPLGCQHLPPESVEMDDSFEGTPLQQFHQSILNDIPKGHWGWSETVTDEGAWNSKLGMEGKSRGVDPGTVYFEPDDVVLLVDSLLDTRRYIRAIFEPFCKVVEACDGVEALEKVDEFKPDLIIADVMLPKMNGFGLLNALKTGTREQQMVPIILLTAMHDARAKGAFSADDYMPKPFNARELIARAHMQLQLGKKRRALEVAFEERTNELRLLTEYSPVGIFRCTEQGYVTYANQAWYEMSGYPPGEPVTNWGDYIAKEYQAHVSKVWEQYVRKAEVTANAEWQWQNGRWVSTTVIRLDRGSGKPPDIIGCTIDSTERKINERLQREQIIGAEQRRAAAEEARRQQELLIDITSHEIRNPISSLMQCASLVKSNLIALFEQMERAAKEGSTIKPTDQLLVTMSEDLEALDSIYQCGLTQERISNDVLSLGKIQLDMLQMFDVETNIRKEAQKLIFVYQNEARMKSIHLNLVMGDSFERLGVQNIMTDPVRLGQVITNLLSNAIRFTSNSPERKVELNVDIGLDPPEDGTTVKPPAHGRDAERSSKTVVNEETPLYLFITVSDTGPGLTPAELDTLFRRFSQASPETHTVYGGSGLGLFVCRQITERMGGRIDVMSKHGKGSQFRFFIRTRACLTPKVAKPTKSASTDSDPGAATFKPHILVVEDNLINRTVLVRQLQHVGLTVETANNGLEALERMRQVQGINGPLSEPPDSHPASNENGDVTGDGGGDGDDTVSDRDIATPLPEPRARPVRPTHHRSSSLPSLPTLTTASTPSVPMHPTQSSEGSKRSKVARSPKSAGGYMGPPRRFDCILMDLEMPVMDGYTSVRKLREDEAAGLLAPSNVVALTGNARQAQIREAMADFTDVVVKPYRLDDLLRTIESSIRKHAKSPAARSVHMADSDKLGSEEAGVAVH